MLHLIGVDGGTWYNFYSGIFGVLVFGGGILVNAYVSLRHHNCHQPGCWRIARLPVQGTAYRTCRKHHPSPPTDKTIQERYHLYAGRRPGRG